MKDRNRYLPFSAQRYSVDEMGCIFDSNDNEIKRFLVDGNWFVDLDWFDGNKSYSVGLVVLVAFNKVSLPQELYNEIELLFQDDDNSNLSPINVIYRFKNGPVAVKEHPGYFYIPFFKDYGINIRGDIRNIATGKDKVWSIGKKNYASNKKGGYFYTRVVNHLGYSSVAFKHRVMCLVFIKYDSNVMQITVNHKDGDASNNKLDNLEWATYSENTKHAYATGLTVGISKAILVKNLVTGVVTSYISQQACARALNLVSGQYVGRRILKNKEFFRDKLCFKEDDDSEWPVVNIEDKSLLYRGYSDRDLVARNVFTGETFIFSDSITCSDYVGVGSGVIRRHLRDSQVIPTNGYNFRHLEEDINWPIHTARQLQIYKKYPFHPRAGLIALNTETNEELFFTSVREGLEHFNITKPAFYHYLYDKVLFKNKYLFTFFKLPENQGHPTE